MKQTVDRNPPSDLVCTICQCSSPDFTDNTLYTELWRNGVKNSAVINNCYLVFVQTRVLISFVDGNHVDNNLKMYVYFG